MPVPFSLSMPTHALFTTVSYGLSLRSQITHFYPWTSSDRMGFLLDGQPGRFSLFMYSRVFGCDAFWQGVAVV